MSPREYRNFGEGPHGRHMSVGDHTFVDLLDALAEQSRREWEVSEDQNVINLARLAKARGLGKLAGAELEEAA